MKQYRIRMTARALADMEEIYLYILKVLLNPVAALKQYNRIADAIESLDIFPERCALLNIEPERSKGFRRLLIDRYSVIFSVESGFVTVYRVIYSSSDLLSRLREK